MAAVRDIIQGHPMSSTLLPIESPLYMQLPISHISYRCRDIDA